jgi:hypothetical protein
VLKFTRIRLQKIVIRHCQEKVVHVLLLVVQFAILDADNYFDLGVFQMAQLILYVTRHVVLSIGDCNIHVQILTCLD